MIQKILFLAFTFTIMVTVTPLVNGGEVKFTESLTSQSSKKSKSIQTLIDSLLKNGIDDKLTRSVGPDMDLPERALIKLFYASSDIDKSGKRACDLVFKSASDFAEQKPDSFVLFDQVKKGHDVTIMNYRFSLDGHLLKAHKMSGLNDENGKPIRGSAKDFDLDIEDKLVRKDAEKLFDFWLSGQYKKYPEKPGP